MAAKNVGTLIREARTAKKISQEQLASEINGLSGNDIGKAERGEKELTQTQLKSIAKVLGITQKSLLEAPKGGSAATKTSSAKTASTAKKTATKAKSATTAKTTTAKKTTSAKTSATDKAGTAAKKNTGTSKTTSSSAKKTGTSSSAVTASNLTATEKKLVELYRAASSDDKKLATKILKGEGLSPADLLPMLGGEGGGLLGMLQGLVK